MSLEERVKYATMKARHQNVLRPWYKKWWGIVVIIIGGLILMIAVASAIYVVRRVQEIRSGTTQESVAQQKEAYLAAIKGNGDNFSLGTDKPQVTIVEFADFACPYCQLAATDIREIMADYSDRVRLVVRDYPLHENSVDLAQAARCAGEQGKFWEAYDKLYTNQENLSVTGDELQTKLLELGSALKLNSPAFSTCLTEKRYTARIKADYEDGETLGIDGTPTWYINNYAVTGYMPAENFRELIAGLLK